MLLEPDQLLDGKYRILRLLGQGGMGAVYEGHHELIDRRIAIKTLLPSVQEEASIVRFEREARAAGRIGNDHILEIYDIGSLADGGRYMVMEYLDGETLSDRIRKRQRLQAGEAIHIALQLLDGLGAAHGAGVLHRDLKPDNIFLVGAKAGVRDFVKIIDFGISKFNLGKDEMRMTATGMVVGTPYYIAPEVAKGLGDVDHRADLYAVGVILYEALAGRVPFDADNFNNLLFKIVLEEAPQLTTLAPDLDPGLAALVHRAMARDKNDRFQTCGELAEALQSWAVAAGVPFTSLDTTTGGGRASQVSIAGAGTPAGGATSNTGQAFGPGQTFGNGAALTPHTSGPSTIQAPAFRAATPGAFGASQPVEVHRPKRPLGLILGAGAGAVVLGATLLIAFSGPSEDDDAGAAASAQAAETLDSAGPAEPTKAVIDSLEPTPSPDAPDTAAAQTAPPATAKPETAADTAKSAKGSTQEPSKGATEPAADAESPAAPPQDDPPTTRPTTQRSPAPAPARPAPAPTTTTTERQRRNFGY